MASGKIIGGPFSDEVVAQLNLRSRIVSKGTRTNEDIQYIAAKTGWAKLTSGVNVGGSSELAEKYIMVGGVKGRTGANTYSNFTGENGKGFRPMPGITGVQINALGQFGQLKEATVTFNCWDRSQITELELLFMRPGFTALLEWGHSIYAKSDTEYEKTPQTITSFFTAGTSKEQLYNEIKELRKQSGYNYEGMFGFIKNFSWTYRADGGYDCTTSLVSIGEIMESLTIDIDTPAITTTVGATTAAGKILPATMLQDVLKTIKESGTNESWKNIQTKFPEFASKHIAVGGRDTLDVGKMFLNSIKTGEEADTSSGQNFSYVSLRSFCELVNTVIIVDNNQKSIIKLNTNITPIGGGDVPTCRFRTYKFHTSSDPGVCVLITEGSKNWSYDETLVGALTSIKEGSTNEILNIYVNANLLESAMTNLLAMPEKTDRNLLNLMNPIFAEINSALGEINDIGLQYEEDEFTYYIVDRKVQVEKEEVSVLNITGLKSTVSQFNFTTKLSPSITTMCAISAQAGATDVGLEAGALLRWNEGLEDRIITRKTMKAESTGFPPITLGFSFQPTTPPAELTPEQARDAQQTDRRKTIQETLGQVYNSKQYDREAVAVARTQYSQFSTNYVQFYADDTAESGNAGPAGIIPFQVAIEMDGISGIKIGQAFRINEGIMPSKYDGVVGFIVTGIDHSITGNRWVTNLKAQTIVLKGTTGNRTGPAYSDDFTETGTSKTEVTGIKTVNVNDAIKEIYIPTLEATLPNASRGLKWLMTAQTSVEGFIAPKGKKKGSLSFRTNNPGNIANTDSGKSRKSHPTLAHGITAQYNHIKLVATNKERNYIIGSKKFSKPNYDSDTGITHNGLNIIYNGSLGHYLKVYATGARDNDNYLNYVIGYFKKKGVAISGSTLLSDIVKI